MSDKKHSIYWVYAEADLLDADRRPLKHLDACLVEFLKEPKTLDEMKAFDPRSAKTVEGKGRDLIRSGHVKRIALRSEANGRFFRLYYCSSQEPLDEILRAEGQHVSWNAGRVLRSAPERGYVHSDIVSDHWGVSVNEAERCLRELKRSGDMEMVLLGGNFLYRPTELGFDFQKANDPLPKMISCHVSDHIDQVSAAIMIHIQDGVSKGYPAQFETVLQNLVLLGMVSRRNAPSKSGETQYSYKLTSRGITVADALRKCTYQADQMAA